MISYGRGRGSKGGRNVGKADGRKRVGWRLFIRLSACLPSFIFLRSSSIFHLSSCIFLSLPPFLNLPTLTFRRLPFFLLVPTFLPSFLPLLTFLYLPSFTYFLLPSFFLSSSFLFLLPVYILFPPLVYTARFCRRKWMKDPTHSTISPTWIPILRQTSPT